MILLIALIFLNSKSIAVELSEVTIKTLGTGVTAGALTPKEITGKLKIPTGDNLPGVILVHGSAGPDSRGHFHSEYLVENGYAVLEINMWKARGVTSFNNRPKHPGDTLPDVWGALKFMADHEKINKNKIAIMGFSWGGVLSLSTAFGLKPNNLPFSFRTDKFAAHIAFYPVCDLWINNGPGTKFVNQNVTSKQPVQIHNGTMDDYDESPDACLNLKNRYSNMNIELHIYEGATHAFDSLNLNPRKIYDSTAKNQKGSEINLIGNEEHRSKAKENVLRFLNENLKINK